MGIRSAAAWLKCRSPLVWLALLALFVRASVAPGFMPDFEAAARGEFKIVICSAGGLKTISLDADGHPVTPQSDASDLCEFASLAFAISPDSPGFAKPTYDIAIPAIWAVDAGAAHSPFPDNRPRAPPSIS